MESTTIKFPFAPENFEAGAPADDVEEGWIQQLEFFKEEVMSSLR